MAGLSELDVFVSAPFQRIRNMGFFKNKIGWTWESTGDYACLYCVAEGVMTLTLRGVRYRAEAGDVIFLRGSDKGAALSAEETDTAHYFLSFYYDEATALGIGPLVRGAAAVTLFRDAERSYRSEAYLYRLKVAQQFLGIIHHLATLTAMESKDYTDTSRLRAATEYINTYYYKRITVRDLCAVSNYSPAHLRRLFLKHYNLPPQEYILQKKLSIARDMILDAPDKNIDEIAEQLAFCSAAYLCKLFKRHFGTSIKQYRRYAAAR